MWGKVRTRAAEGWHRLPGWARVGVILVAAWLVVRLVVGLIQQPSEPTQEEAAAALDSLTTEVHFEVEGTESYNLDGDGMAADVTVSGPDGSEQGQNLAVPMNRDGVPGIVKHLAAGSAVSLVAQISSDEPGAITCRITADGVVVSEKTSEGRYAVVSCSGKV